MKQRIFRISTIASIALCASTSLIAQTASISGGSKGASTYTQTITTTNTLTGKAETIKVKVTVSGVYGAKNAISQCDAFKVSYQTTLHGLPATIEYAVKPPNGKYLSYDETTGLTITNEAQVTGQIVVGAEGSAKTTAISTLVIAKSGLLEDSWLAAKESTLPETPAEKIKAVVAQTSNVSDKSVPHWLFKVNRTHILNAE